MTDYRFTPEIIAAAQASHKKFWPSGPFVSITLAQWAIESAYGRYESGKNNYFGIKATQTQINANLATRRWTKEFVNGQYRSFLLYFADYPGLTEGFDAHGQLLISHHYLACINATTVLQYAQALHTCGYATDPRYPQLLMQVIDNNNLTQFDQRF